MPLGKYYHKQSGRWLSKETRQAFDYDSVDPESSVLLISFFRWYPDYLLDIIESENADYSLELPQRLILRSFARFEQVYITGSRGLTKTYCVLLSAMLDGLLFPGEIVRYYAPSQKQAAELAGTAFHQIEKNYPALASSWLVKTETKDTFKIISSYGSEVAIGAIQGGNCSQLIAEEIGQETDPKFDFNDFESKVIPTCRLARQVNRTYDKVHINGKQKIITNASSRINPAYYKYHNGFMRQMIHGEKYEAIVLDMSWEVAVISTVRTKGYMENLRRSMTSDDFMRQMCATYTGTNESPIVTEENLSRSRKIMAMENAHCGDDSVIYIVSHDVSYENGAKNAECADAVIKLTRFKSISKRDKYRKQVVYCDSYAPPKTDYLQAMKLKDLWRKYCKDGAQATYMVIDARAYGKSVIEELMKPSNDGMMSLCCYNHLDYVEMEQAYALPIIYPIKATRGGLGAKDSDAEMIRYAQREFEQGNIELLTASTADGLEQYKRRHGIKDDDADISILLPYRKTDELCQQIKNLRMDASGTSLKEERKSKGIQRDIWSALKYGLHMSQILEKTLIKENYTTESAWEQEIRKYKAKAGNTAGITTNGGTSERSRLIGLRHR